MLVDLRSDTVTQPTPAMREAMARARVGDDVYGEDPTVNQLEELAAELTGHEAAMLVPSGTMGNLAAILAHCGRGDEVIVGDKSHTFLFEAGGISALGGVHSHQLPNQPDGSLRLEDIEAAIRPDDPHFPISRLLSLENTHNRCGGTFQTVETMQAMVALAHAHGLKVHLDGARVFNAAAVLGVEVRALTGMVDSVTFCLSKGLCAPVGSVVCGSREFIARARRVRKMLGGGMRQAGVLAAAGIVALETMRERLIEDHQRAQRLAEGLRRLPGFHVDEGSPATNMVFGRLDDAVPLDDAAFMRAMAERGVLIHDVAPRRYRFVTHYWVDDAALQHALDAFADVLG